MKIRARTPELLFALTAATCWTAGISHAVGYRTLTIGREATLESVSPFDGLWFAFGILGILGSHELGHWWTARRYGLRILMPFFIPGPTLAGTFGAFLHLQDPPPTRRCSFDIAAAGPLAGLAATLPVLWIGVTLSTPAPREATAEQSARWDSRRCCRRPAHWSTARCRTTTASRCTRWRSRRGLACC